MFGVTDHTWNEFRELKNILSQLSYIPVYLNYYNFVFLIQQNHKCCYIMLFHWGNLLDQSGGP